MNSLIRLEVWLALSLLLVLARDSAAQTPQQQPGNPEVELPPLLVVAKPLKEDPKDDELRKLLKARYNEVVAEVNALYGRYKNGAAGIEIFLEPGQRLVHSGLELCDKPGEKVTLLKKYVQLTKAVEKDVQVRHEAGAPAYMSLHRARYLRLDAEIQLLRATREAERAKAK